MKTILHTSNPDIRQLQKRPSAAMDLTSTDVNITFKEMKLNYFYEDWRGDSKAAIHERKI
jgi:hypothetical protein